jgi:magnesium transporter
VPSPGLLRYLRSQSENLGFFSSRHEVVQTLAHASRKTKQYRQPQQRHCTLPIRETIPLQAGVFDLRLLGHSPKGPRAAAKKPQFFTSSIRSQWNSADEKRSFGSPWRPSLFGNGRANDHKGDTGDLRPDDLPEFDGDFDSNSMFNNHRQMSKKAALEPRLRCTEVDENGEAILVDGEFKKSELIARFGLLPRDLRKIDSSNLPHILVRPTAILLNLLHLRVLIKHDRVLLFDVYGSKSSYPQSAFMYDLQHKLRQKAPASNGGLPYEFRALEAVLQSVTQELESDFETVRDPIIRILSELEDDIDRQKLRILLVLSKRVSTFSQKATLVRDALDELLEADDDLRDMYLTEKMHDLYRDVDQHTEVEMLLESYHKLCDEIVQEASNLVSGIRNTEEM